MVDYWGFAEDRATLEARLATATVGGRSALVASLAWFLHRSNPQQSLDLAVEAGLSEAPAPAVRGRLALARGAAERQLGMLDAAGESIELARRSFVENGDAIGEGDALLAEAELAADQGAVSRIRPLLAQAAGCFAGRDPVREIAALALDGEEAALVGDFVGAATTAVRLGVPDAIGNAGSRALVARLHGAIHFGRGEFVSAARHWQAAAKAALEAEDPRTEACLAAEIGRCFARLNDHASALAWKERAARLARQLGGPLPCGLALVELGDTLRSLGQVVRARMLLHEGVSLLEPLAGSRVLARACGYLGQFLVEQGEVVPALEQFDRQEMLSRAQNDPAALGQALRGKAEALQQLGRVAEAVADGERALALAREAGDRWSETGALRSLASIYAAHDLPPPPEALAPSPAIHFLEQAHAIARGIEAYLVPPALFADLSRAYEAVGQPEKALLYERRNAAGWATLRTREVGLLAEQQPEEAIAHHRRLAAAETERAAALQEAKETLQRLAEIGQEITASLDLEAVFETIRRHLAQLLDGPICYIGLLNEAESCIDVPFRVRYGERLPPMRFSLDDGTRMAVLCVVEGREILWGYKPDEDNPWHIPGTLPVDTALFRPLRIGDRILGVLTVQTPRLDAYGPRELLIFRTLCAYGAVAVANAEAYRTLDRTLDELRGAQDRLVAEERRAVAETERARSLQEATETLERLGQIGQQITATLDAEVVFDALHGHLNELLDARTLSIFLMERDGKELVRRFGFEDGVPLPVTRLPLDHPGSFAARCARERRELLIDMDPAVAYPTEVPGTQRMLSLLFEPLIVADRVLGVMTVQATRAQAYGARERQIFRSLSAYAGIALANIEALEALKDAQTKLEQLAYFDVLTGLPNRRMFTENIRKLLAQAQRRDERFALLLMDLDDFKSINDTLGHDAGDSLLIEVAARLTAAVRDTDSVARLGGDEFAILVADGSDPESVAAVCKRIMESFAVGIPIKGTTTKTGVSIGAALFPGHGATQDALYKSADLALYEAKRAGGNVWRWCRAEA